MSGASLLGIEAHGTYVDHDVENIFKSVSRTCNSTTINKYNENNTKLDNIQEYVKNYVYNTQNSNSLKQNVENNLKNIAEVEQINDYVVKFINIDGNDNTFKVEQINEMATNIVAQYEALAQEAINAINDTVAKTDTVTEVQTAMDNGLFDEYIATCANNMATANKAVFDNDLTSDIKTTFRRIEHWLLPLVGVNASIDIQKIKSKTNMEFLTEDFVTNVCTASLINNTEFFNKVSSAYNETLNTINSTVAEMKLQTDAINEAVSKQSSRIVMEEGVTIKGDRNKVLIIQKNTAVADISACAVVKAIADVAATNTTGAIMADIIGITNDFSNKTENKTEMTSENTIWHENQSEAALKDVISVDHGASTKKTWFIVACIICVVLLIAGVIGAIFAGKRKNEKEIREMELKADVAKSAMQHGVTPNSINISATPNVKDVAKANAINTTTRTVNTAISRR